MEPTPAGYPSSTKRAKHGNKHGKGGKARSKRSSPSKSPGHSRSPGATDRKASPSPRTVDGVSPLSGDDANSPAPPVGKPTPESHRMIEEPRRDAGGLPVLKPTDDDVARHDAQQPGVAPTAAGTAVDNVLPSDTAPPGGSRPLYLEQGPHNRRRTTVDSHGSPSHSLRNQRQPRQSVSSLATIRARKFRLRNTFIAVVGGIVVVIVAIAFFMAPSRRTHFLASTCTSFACEEYSKRLRASLNTSVNPCVSFTRFVCDGWHQKNVLSVWEDRFLGVLRKLNRTLRNIRWPLKGQNNEHRAAAAYQSCNDVFIGKSDELPAVKRALTEAGVVWPRPSKDADALYTLLYCSLRLGWGTLLDFKFRTSGKTTTLVVREGKSAFLLQRVQDTPRTTGEKKACFEFLEESFRETGNDSVSFELMSSYDDTTSHMLAHVYYGPTVLRPLNDVLSKAHRINLTAPRWTEALEKFNIRLHAAPLVMSTTNVEYLDELVSVWNEYGEDSFHSLISWCTVQIAALYANRLLILNHYGRSEEKAELYHTAFCVSRAAFFAPRATFARYNREVLSVDGEAMAREIAQSVRSAILRHLLSWPQFNENITVVGNWSSLEVMFKSFQRVRKNVTIQNDPLVDMTSSFVKNWQRSVLFNRTPGVENLMRAINYVYYYTSEEKGADFQLTPYALSYPLFDRALPMCVNYGGLGDEVASALGDFLVAAYYFPNVSQIETFIDCLRAGPYGSVSSFRSHAARTLTLGALIKAFKTSGCGTLGLLPGLEGYSGLQTFFIARCYTDCEGSGTSYGEDTCNFHLLYTPEFAEAFQCSPGDPMVAPHQCRLHGW